MHARVFSVVIASMLVTFLAVPSVAQEMTASEVQRLQDSVGDVGTDIAAMRKRDAVGARTLQRELDELQEEVIYLKVKQRKEGRVSRSDYSDTRDRIEDLRARANGENGSRGGYSATAPVVNERDDNRTPARRSSSRAGTVPVGTELDVRLQTALNSGTTQVEDRFEATTLVDLMEDGRVLIPAGSVLRGIVSEVKSSGRVERKGSLTLSFEQITINRRSHPIRATVSEALESGGYREDAGKIGAGAIVGGIIGGILGGGKGAIAGVLIGGGGVVAATEGQEVDLDSGTVLRIRLDEALALGR